MLPCPAGAVAGAVVSGAALDGRPDVHAARSDWSDIISVSTTFIAATSTSLQLPAFRARPKRFPSSEAAPSISIVPAPSVRLYENTTSAEYVEPTALLLSLTRKRVMRT